jgi:hypothetical protein
VLVDLASAGMLDVRGPGCALVDVCRTCCSCFSGVVFPVASGRLRFLGWVVGST